MAEVRTVLAVGAHPDDLELGCGATLAKLVRGGVRVRALVLTEGTAGAAAGQDRCAETRAALGALGVDDLHQARLPDTGLPGALAEAVRLLEAQCRELQPDRVYTMFKDDRHQDHRAAYEACMVACRRVPQLLGYETPSSWPNYVPAVFEPVDDLLERKIAALRCHASQRQRSYMDPAQIRCSARFRGQQVGLGPCEGFIPYRMVL